MNIPSVFFLRLNCNNKVHKQIFRQVFKAFRKDE